jgi:hypothetical protein
VDGRSCEYFGASAVRPRERNAVAVTGGVYGVVAPGVTALHRIRVDFSCSVSCRGRHKGARVWIRSGRIYLYIVG